MVNDPHVKKQILKQRIKDLKAKVTRMSHESSLKEISDLILEEATALTRSEFCYVAYVDPENGDSVGISFSHITEWCQMYEEMGEARFRIRKDGTYGGLLGYSLDTGESFYTHNPTYHPAAHGIPKGHERVDQFLSVAAKFDDEILGQIVLANPEQDYSDSDLKIAEEIASIYARSLKKLL